MARSQVAQEQLRRMTRRVITAQEEERKLISRELHDEIAQILTGINVQLAILKQASTVNDRGLRQRIAHTQRFVEKSVTAVHRFARELRPAVLDDLGLVPALRALIRNQPEGRSLHIRFVSDPGIEVLDGAKRTVIYRVAQEALTNVARHAHATQATVQVKKSPLGIELEVRDNGRAFDVQRVLGSRNRKHLGLLGMRERVEMVGGVLTIESSPGKGTAICAHIPLKKTAKAASP
ncbi:MAG TPA: sensor histidine kinase [Opitutaceae bacterium]|nr:sensor histidine kinase [Opitutaceae bacterium]